jgi:hypothetical protein
MIADEDGVMWIQLKYMLPRCNSKRNVTANTIVSGAGSVKCLCYVLALINALDMAIAVVDSVR